MTSPNSKGKTLWQPGQSGNPAGKPKGSGEVQKLRAAIAKHVPEIVNQLVDAAKGGDIQAARLLLERTLPPLRPMDQPQQFALPDGSFTDKAKAVLDAISSGDLPTAQGSQLLGAIAGLGRLTEIDELTARIEALESKRNQ